VSLAAEPAVSAGRHAAVRSKDGSRARDASGESNRWRALHARPPPPTLLGKSEANRALYSSMQQGIDAD